jgi:hypothetical protein
LAVLTADGRFGTRTDDNQLRERRLTPAGVQRVRDELVATGLFERDQRFPLGAFVAGFASQDHQGRLIVEGRPLLPDRTSCSGEYVQ